MKTYKDNFDHLGQLRHGDYQPWVTRDKVFVVSVAIAILVLMAASI